MFEIEDKQYELKYSMNRIKAIEQVMEDSIMATLQREKGMLSLQDLSVMFGYALREVGSDIFVAPKKAMAFAEQLIEKEGYVAVNMAVIEQIQEDCPFFFRVD